MPAIFYVTLSDFLCKKKNSGANILPLFQNYLIFLFIFSSDIILFFCIFSWFFLQMTTLYPSDSCSPMTPFRHRHSHQTMSRQQSTSSATDRPHFGVAPAMNSHPTALKRWPWVCCANFQSTISRKPPSWTGSCPSRMSHSKPSYPCQKAPSSHRIRRTSRNNRAEYGEIWSGLPCGRRSSIMYSLMWL